jgi:hypothetical protein
VTRPPLWLVLLVASIAAVCGSTGTSGSASGAASPLVSTAQVKRAFAAQGLKLRALPASEIISNGTPSARIYLEPRQGSQFNLAIYGSLIAARKAELGTPTTDPFTGFKLVVVRRRNVVVLVRRGAPVMPKVQAALDALP